MTIKKAVEILVGFYKSSLKNAYVCKPIAYSLYQTWKYVDARERARRVDEVER